MGGFKFLLLTGKVYLSCGVIILLLTIRLGDVAAFENRHPVTEVKFINKSPLFILLLGVIRRLELKPICEQKLNVVRVAFVLVESVHKFEFSSLILK
ncbi:hypothetical protein BH10BAC3_BH10BAC3_02550 [soil metagenome]